MWSYWKLVCGQYWWGLNVEIARNIYSGSNILSVPWFIWVHWLSPTAQKQRHKDTPRCAPRILNGCRPDLWWATFKKRKGEMRRSIPENLWPLKKAPPKFSDPSTKHHRTPRILKHFCLRPKSLNIFWLRPGVQKTCKNHWKTKMFLAGGIHKQKNV